jgi:thymidylate kinase
MGEILHGLGFVLARPTRDRQLPGILDYYGRDGDSGRIIHVHAHYQLVVGDDMTKNFRLPIEHHYLTGRLCDGPLPIPTPEWEYLVFVIRMVVKHSPWDAQLARKGKLSLSERRELADLTASADPGMVTELRQRHLPLIDDDLFDACESAINGSVSRVQRMVIARRLLRALDALGRSGRSVDLGLRIWRRGLRRLRRTTGWQLAGKRPDVGGSIVAVVGSDGSGKSTTVGMLTDHLANDFAVRRIHMGKPPWARLSRLIRRPMRKARTFGLFESTRLTPWTDFSDAGFPGYGYLIWHLLIARDRYFEYRRARRASGKGEVVISDRWPLNRIRLMDGPRLQKIPGTESRPFATWLCDREFAYYEAMLPPDLVVVLRVSPDVAAVRRTEDPPDFVRRRATEVREADWNGLPALIVDADQDLETVLREVRTAVWNLL